MKPKDERVKNKFRCSENIEDDKLFMTVTPYPFCTYFNQSCYKEERNKIYHNGIPFQIFVKQ
jgi:hypothetical protein